jgi:hypothetical protein
MGGSNDPGATTPPPGQPAPPAAIPAPLPPASAPPPPASAPAPAAGTPAPAAASSPMSGAFASMSQAELMIGGGALLIVLIDLIFAVFLGSYSFSQVLWAGAVVALLAVAMTHFMRMTLPFAYTSLLMLAGAVVAITSVRELLRDLIFLTGRSGPVRAEFLLGALGLYVGVALMVFGVWTMWRSRAA